MIITNREEVIDKAFGVFVRMNYEKASIITLAKACGVTKTGIVYYFPHKLDLFMAVADKYVLKMHEPGNKFATPADFVLTKTKKTFSPPLPVRWRSSSGNTWRG